MESPANRSLVKFPANREKYRELLEFALQIPPVQLDISMIQFEFRINPIELGVKWNRELSPLY
jgi:hypothetical protein